MREQQALDTWLAAKKAEREEQQRKVAKLRVRLEKNLLGRNFACERIALELDII